MKVVVVGSINYIVASLTSSKILRTLFPQEKFSGWYIWYKRIMFEKTAALILVPNNLRGVSSVKQKLPSSRCFPRIACAINLQNKGNMHCGHFFDNPKQRSPIHLFLFHFSSIHGSPIVHGEIIVPVLQSTDQTPVKCTSTYQTLSWVAN